MLSTESSASSYNKISELSTAPFLSVLCSLQFLLTANVLKTVTEVLYKTQSQPKTHGHNELDNA